MNLHQGPLPDYLLSVIVVLAVVGSLSVIYGKQFLDVRRFAKSLATRFPELPPSEIRRIIAENRSTIHKMSFAFLRRATMADRQWSDLERLPTNAETGEKFTVAPGKLSVFFARRAIDFPQRVFEMAGVETPEDPTQSLVQATASGLKSSIARSNVEAAQTEMLPRLRMVWLDWLRISKLPDDIQQAIHSAFFVTH